jgi:hypothetical protein
MHAGVDEDGLDFGMALHLAHQRSDLGKIGMRPDSINDFQFLGHEPLACKRNDSAALPFFRREWSAAAIS